MKIRKTKQINQPAPNQNPRNLCQDSPALHTLKLKQLTFL